MRIVANCREDTDDATVAEPLSPDSAAVLKRTYSSACCTPSAILGPPLMLALGVKALGVAAIGVELPLVRPDVEARPSRSAAITYERPSLKKLHDCSLPTL